MDAQLSKLLTDELNNLSKNVMKAFSDRIDGLADRLSKRVDMTENSMEIRIAKLEDTVRKYANTISVLAKLVARAQNISMDELEQMLIEAEGLTNEEQSTTDLCFGDVLKECEIENFQNQRLKDLLKNAGILPTKTSNTGNPSVDPKKGDKNPKSAQI